MAEEPLTPSQRSTRARAGAHALHARYDSTKITAPARRAFQAKFEQQVDPDGVLPEAERLRRAEHAYKAHFQAMALKSAKARASRRSANPKQSD